MCHCRLNFFPEATLCLHQGRHVMTTKKTIWLKDVPNYRSQHYIWGSVWSHVLKMPLSHLRYEFRSSVLIRFKMTSSRLSCCVSKNLTRQTIRVSEAELYPGGFCLIWLAVEDSRRRYRLVYACRTGGLIPSSQRIWSSKAFVGLHRRSAMHLTFDVFWRTRVSVSNNAAETLCLKTSLSFC